MPLFRAITIVATGPQARGFVVTTTDLRPASRRVLRSS